MKDRTARIIMMFSLIFFGSPWKCASASDYCVQNDFYVSVWEDFKGDSQYQVDDYLFLDVYRAFKTLDFHSEMRVTNDFNMTEAEEAQLTLAYLTANRLFGHWNIAAGRQFFYQGFDGYITDGLLVEYWHTNELQCTLHFGAPFNAESQTIEPESILVYGINLEANNFSDPGIFPFKISAQLERRDNQDWDELDQTLIGLEALVELPLGLLYPDIYADVEYEGENNRLRRVKIGSQFYPTALLSCRLEGERYDPDTLKLSSQSGKFFQEEIVNLFSHSEITSGSFALDYIFPKGRNFSLRYSLQRYLESLYDETFGHGIDLYFMAFSHPRNAVTMGCGYYGRMISDDQLHMGIVRVAAKPSPATRLSLLAEVGMLNTPVWDNEAVLHLRGAFDYYPRSNLQTSLLLEESSNPYFHSDFRAIIFFRLLLGQGSVKR